MAQKPILKKPEPLTAAIISYMKPGEERADTQCAGLRVRCLAPRWLYVAVHRQSHKLSAAVEVAASLALETTQQ